MSEVSYQFVPWVRSGLAATLTTPDTLDTETPGRARLDVALGVSRRGGPLPPVEQRLTVVGPGEVVGLDPRQIIRTDPLRGATDAEPNMLVQVELDRPDLPWLFTPAAADVNSRLRPWLVLVVVGGAELFTGNNLIVMAWAGRRVDTRALLRNWAIVYAGSPGRGRTARPCCCRARRPTRCWPAFRSATRRGCCARGGWTR